MKKTLKWRNWTMEISLVDTTKYPEFSSGRYNISVTDGVTVVTEDNVPFINVKLIENTSHDELIKYFMKRMVSIRSFTHMFHTLEELHKN
jgi:hypothetical protein